MNSNAGVVVVGMVTIGVLFGALFAWAIADGGWIKDCETICIHRIGDKVYTCELRGRK